MARVLTRVLRTTAYAASSLLAASTAWPSTPATRAAQAPAAAGRVLAFLAAPAVTDAADPVVPLPGSAWEARAGDVLVYLLRVSDARAGARGVEALYADGRRTSAAVAGARERWDEVRVPLRADGAVERFELVARGANGGQIAFQVDDVRVERADGTRIDVFTDQLAGGQRRIAAFDGTAAAVVVPLEDDFAPDHVASSAAVGDPWSAIDLAGLRALDREPEEVDGTDLPEGLVWTGPGVPLRFADRGGRVSFAMRGQRIGFEPLDGGRFYEVWLALVNTTGSEIHTRVAVQGVDRERTGVPLRVPAAGADGYAPEDGEGHPARAFALLELDVAAATSLASLQLPDDPRLRVLAITIAWRRDGAGDARFRQRWLERAARGRPDLSVKDRADLARYLANRRAGAVFGGVDDEAQAERALFDALLASDAKAFRARLDERLAAQVAAAQGRKSARVELVAMLPRPDDDLTAALRAGVLPADVPVVGGDARALAALDAETLAVVVARAAAGTWRTFGSALDARSAARLGADALSRAISGDARATARMLGNTGGLARVDGDLGRIRNVPQFLAAAGARTVLVDRATRRAGAPFVSWDSAGASVLVAQPAVRVEGPLRFDADVWRGWTEAASSPAGRPPIPVLCDVSAPAARETLALAAELDAADMAPDIAWASLEDAAEAARGRAPRLAPVEPAPLVRRDLRAELDALAAVRAAERELQRAGAVESLARVEGAPAPGAALERAWSSLREAARLDPARARAAAAQVGADARNAAASRLARLQAAAPLPGPGIPVAVIDALPWPRRSLIELPDGELRVASASGDLPAQRAANGGVLVELVGSGTAPIALSVRRDALAEDRAPARVRLEGWTIRTDELVVVIDPTTGRVASLKLPGKDVELLREGGETLAWIAPNAAPEPIEKLEKIEFVERGPLRAVVRSVRSSSRARVETEIRVTGGAAGLELRTRTTLLDATGDVVLALPVARASASALVSVPLGSAPIAAHATNLRALDGWAAATDGTATVALVGESGVAFGWNDRTFRVVLAEAGAGATRAAELRVLGRAGGWRSANLDATALELALEPVRVAFDGAQRSAVRPRDPLVRIARIERDGKRTTGPAAGILPLAIEPGADGTIEVRLLEVRGEAAQVEIAFAREPFGAERADLLGNSSGSLTVTGRAIDVSIGAGRFEIVRARLDP